MAETATALKELKNTTTKKASTSTEPIMAPAPLEGEADMLGIGSKGDSVKELQTALNGAGYSLDVDGVFGDQTANALKQWQTANGLEGTGVFNTASRDLLYAKPATDTAASTDPYTTIRNDLISQLQNSIGNGYTPKTEEQIQQEAAARVQTQYDTQRLAAQQAADRQQLALDQQLASLGADYDRAVEESNRQYNRTASQFDRSMLSRGMQRSSYLASTLANIGNQGARAASDIRLREAQARSGIEGQRAQLAEQLAQQMAQYDVSQLNDAMAYADQLRDQEYSRGVQERSTTAGLAQNLLQILMNAQQQNLSQDQWERQFAESIREWNLANGYNADGTEKKKKSTGGKSTTTPTNPDKDTTTNNVTQLYNNMISALSGANSAVSTALNGKPKSIGGSVR